MKVHSKSCWASLRPRVKPTLSTRPFREACLACRNGEVMHATFRSVVATRAGDPVVHGPKAKPKRRYNLQQKPKAEAEKIRRSKPKLKVCKTFIRSAQKMHAAHVSRYGPRLGSTRAKFQSNSRLKFGCYRLQGACWNHWKPSVPSVIMTEAEDRRQKPMFPQP